MRRLIVVSRCFAVSLFLTGLTGGALAQQAPTGSAFPTKPIRLIVTFPAGAGGDIIARTLAGKLSESLGQQVVIDNRGGASGIIGMEAAAKAAPDGYTLVQGTVSTLCINPALFKSMPYDTQRDFVPISMNDDSVIVMVTHPSLPVKSVKEFIALAKTRQGQIGYGSGGTGSVQHLVAHMFSREAGVDMIHVPYKGAAPAFVDLLAGQIQVIFSGMISATPHIESGKLRALAITASKRMVPYENLPTMKESGGPDIRASFWTGTLAPAKTPPAIVDRLNAEIVKALRSPDYIERTRASGGTPVSSTPEEFARFIASESARYAKAVQESGARAD